jgi:hypothetical protein
VTPLPGDARHGTPLAKADVASLGLSGVACIIDADCIVTGSLRDMFRRAASGRICAVRDDLPPGRDRSFGDWEWLLGLSSPVRPGETYVNAGMLCLSTEHWPNLLGRWAEVTRRLPVGRYVQGRSDLNPIWAADQDVLNAILMSEVPPSALDVLPEGTMAYAQRRNTRIVDIEKLRVTTMGRASTVAHFSLGPKPWAPGGWRRVGVEPLLPLFTRCLLGDDLAVRPSPITVPWWLRSSPGVDALRPAVGVGNRASSAVRGAAWRAYDRLPPRTQARLRRLRGREIPRISTVGRSDSAPATTALPNEPRSQDMVDAGTGAERTRSSDSSLPRVG